MRLSSFAIAIVFSVVAVPASSFAQDDASTFDRDAAVNVLSSVDFSQCKKVKGKKAKAPVLGEGHVLVTYDPKGTASEATIDRGPMVGTASQKCLEGLFKKTKVPAFTGTPVKVGKAFKFE